MNHAEATSLLTDFVSGDLEPGLRAKIQRHVSECEECRTWVDASEFLVEALSTGKRLVERPHPSSEEIVDCALRPEALGAAAREEIAHHETRCSQCHNEIQTVRSAVAEAREAAEAMERAVIPEPVPFLRSSWARVGTPARLALAASVLFLLSAWVGERAISRVPSERVLTGEVFAGEQTVSARRSLVVGESKVSTGARVVFEGGEVVAFGNGFSVDAGGSLTVSTGDKRDSPVEL